MSDAYNCGIHGWVEGALYHCRACAIETQGELDRDAGHEEPWAWGAERYLYSRQLQDANKRIYELEGRLAGADRHIIENGNRIRELFAENEKLREQLKALTSGQTVSVPLSAWNKLCAEAAKSRPLAEEEPEAFPARALRFSA